MARNKSNRVVKSSRRFISGSDLVGPKPVPREIVIKDYYGPGEDGVVCFLPLKLNISWEVKTDVDQGELGRILAEQLSKTIVNPDGSPLMTVDGWGEMTLDRLIEVSSKLMKAVSDETPEGNA